MCSEWTRSFHDGWCRSPGLGTSFRAIQRLGTLLRGRFASHVDLDQFVQSRDAATITILLSEAKSCFGKRKISVRKFMPNVAPRSTFAISCLLYVWLDVVATLAMILMQSPKGRFGFERIAHFSLRNGFTLVDDGTPGRYTIDSSTSGDWRSHNILN